MIEMCSMGYLFLPCKKSGCRNNSTKQCERELNKQYMLASQTLHVLFSGGRSRPHPAGLLGNRMYINPPLPKVLSPCCLHQSSQTFYITSAVFSVALKPGSLFVIFWGHIGPSVPFSPDFMRHKDHSIPSLQQTF